MEYQKIVKEVKNGQVSPLYLFYGTEEYLIREMVSFMEKQVIQPDTRDFNYSAYDLKETPVEIALEDGETVPFMAERRLVIAKNALFLTGSRIKNTVEHHLDALSEYVKNPPDYSTVIFIVPQDKLDERKKVVKQLKKNAVVSGFHPLQGAELEAWVEKRARFYHVSIEKEAVQLLIAISGSNLQLLNQEINKMSLYVGTEGQISAEVVETMASRSLEQDIFSLIDRVANLKLNEALRILYDLLQNKEEPIKILSLLVRQFRIILQVKILEEKGYSQKQMASQLKLHPYVVKLASQQGRRFNEKTLRSIIKWLADEDVRMKSGQTDKVLALEMFLMKLKEWVV